MRHLGFYLAGWNLPNHLRAGPTSQQYNVPGRMASVCMDQRDPDRALAFLVFLVASTKSLATDSGLPGYPPYPVIKAA